MKEIPAINIREQFFDKGGLEFLDHTVVGQLQLNFENSKSFTANNCVFENTVEINSSQNLNLTFTNTEFKKRVTINCNRGNLLFLNCEILEGIAIASADKANIDLSGTQLSREVIITGLIGRLSLTETKFQSFENNDRVIIRDCIISHDFGCKQAKLSNANFNKSTFKQIATFDDAILKYSNFPGAGNFWDVIFEGKAYFNNTTIEKSASFIGTEFHDIVIFLSVNTSDNASGDFSAAKFHKRAFFNHSKFSKLTFNNSEFLDLVSFKDLKCLELNMANALFAKGADFLRAEITNADRETFRIIKNEFIKINNGVEALVFRAKEMIAYEKEIPKKTRLSEWFLVWLNKVSNHYGLSWVRGFCFTFIVGFLFYILYLSSLHHLPFNWGWGGVNGFVNAIDNSIKYFIKFFIITHDLDFMDSYGPTGISYLIDFFSKIFIGYGIYQTIQAFRKHGK
jgi:hypothetical protein